MKSSNRLTMTIVAGLVWCCVVPVKAQNSIATSAHNAVAIIHVKPDMLNEWIDLQKSEVIPALKKAEPPRAPRTRPCGAMFSST